MSLRHASEARATTTTTTGMDCVKSKAVFVGKVVGVLLVHHFVHWVTGWVYYRLCAKSFFHSLVTHGSNVCTALDTVHRSSLVKYGADMVMIAGMY